MVAARLGRDRAGRSSVFAVAVMGLRAVAALVLLSVFAGSYFAGSTCRGFVSAVTHVDAIVSR